MQQYLCNVTYKDVLWLPGESSSLVLCPICKALDYHQLQLSVPSLADGSTRNLFQCKTCDSRFFNPPELCEFSEITGDSENFHKHYCEPGIRRALRLDHRLQPAKWRGAAAGGYSQSGHSLSAAASN